LRILRDSGNIPALGPRRLTAAFRDAGRPLRNAGAFCAILADARTTASWSLPLDEVLRLLRDPVRPLRWRIRNAAAHVDLNLYPSPAAFEHKVLQKLETYSDEDLRTWFRHGRGPARQAARQLAEQMPLRRTLAGMLATLLERPRLAGARPYVAQMLSALTLPPRRLVRPELPMGGYSDVTHRGQPDQLLPSQFALDEWDFLRRYADNELLYFRREDPHDRSRHELVVLLDQGVRTWGDVRMVLGAAVLALGRQAIQRKVPFLLATTSNRGTLVDPLETDDEGLGKLIEASDLSANPGLAMESVLEQKADVMRDVVLLTQPRNLAEDDVRAAAMRAMGNVRLLALTLDATARRR